MLSGLSNAIDIEWSEVLSAVAVALITAIF